MTEWTSISLKESQKAQLKDHKPDDMSMGTYLVQLVNNNDIETGESNPIDADIETIIRESIHEALENVTIEQSDDAKDAGVLADRLMQTLQGLDEDVQNAAFKGAREAVEEVAR